VVFVNYSLLNRDVELFTSIIVLCRCLHDFLLGGGLDGSGECREMCVVNRSEASVLLQLGMWGTLSHPRVWQGPDTGTQPAFL